MCIPAVTTSSTTLQVQWFRKTFKQNAPFTQVLGGKRDTLSFQTVRKTHAGIYKAEFKFNDQLIGSTNEAEVRVKCE